MPGQTIATLPIAISPLVGDKAPGVVKADFGTGCWAMWIIKADSGRNPLFRDPEGRVGLDEPHDEYSSHCMFTT